MRILMVGTFSFPEGGGGAARALQMQAKGLTRAGHEVLVVVCRGTLGEKTAELDGFKVKSFTTLPADGSGLAERFSWLRRQIGMLLYLAYAIVTRRFDSIIFYGAAPVFALAAVAGKLLKHQTCFVQGDLMDSLDRRLLVKSEEVLSRNASLILVGGSSLLEQHVTGIAPSAKCLRLWPPTDTDFYGSGSAASARSSLNLGDATVIAYAGAISSLEGVDMLIRSMKYVVTRYPDAKLVVAGTVLAHDPITGAPLDYRGLVDSLALTGRVMFAGSLRMSEVADLMAAADVLVNPKVDHPANRVAAPIKIGEYLASRRPVLTTRVCELDEWLVDRQEVLFCKPGNPLALAEGICTILSDADLSERLARQGALVARHVCDYRVWGARVAEAIEKSGYAL